MFEITDDEKPLLDKIMEVAVHRGFLIPTAEIYPKRLAGFYDFGPVGVLLKRNIVNFWRSSFVTGEVNPVVYEIEGSVVLPEQVLVASGHATSFTDPVVNCTNPKCNGTFRADHLVEDATGKFVEGLTPDELGALIEEHGLKCPSCGAELEPPDVFNLMLSTRVGPKSGVLAYLRPETAQSIFLAYKRVQQSMRANLPFGIAQVGNSFRNEIAPRQGLLRLRAFSQMEIEMFVHPDDVDDHPNIDAVKHAKIRLITQEAQRQDADPEGVVLTLGEALEKRLFPNEYLAYYVGKEALFFEALGIPFDAIRFRHMLPEETPFYSKGNYDVEIKLSVGWKEVVGNAYRTDHDLSTHMKHSGTRLTFTVNKQKIVPHVVEPSCGVERPFYCMLEHSYREKGEARVGASARDWAWFQFPPALAPYTVHVFPLQKRDGLPEKAREVHDLLKSEGFTVIFDHAGSIGKRYARADEIGTPYCVTVDYKTIAEEPEAVTIRDRDTTGQVRVEVAKLPEIIRDLVRGKVKFEDAGSPVD
ncbi:MAG: glycine--tRNA ligase [Promethearchaeota archaeon]